MGPILIAPRGELDSNKCVEIEHSKGPACSNHILRFGDIGIRSRLVRSNLFVGKYQVDSLARRCIGAVQKNIERCGMPIDETDRLERRFRLIEVFASNQDVNVLRIPNSGFIDGGDPCCNSVSAGNRVMDSRLCKRA